VGESAFATKAGIHASAILKDPETYEHIPPETVGNERRVLVSEQGGQVQPDVRTQACRHPARRKETGASTRCSPKSRSARPKVSPMTRHRPSFELLAKRALGGCRIIST
jgi:2-isopropylmalate synthase